MQALNRQAAVAIVGPRQVGKTTLALKIAQLRPAVYLDLEAPRDLAKLQSPELFLDQNRDKLVILDEIHRAPELFQVLRGAIDQSRREGRRTGLFLILGSASVDLLRQSGETLAGRIAYVDMSPITAMEIPADRANLDRLWLRGGFPDSYLADSDRDSFALREDFIRTYLERDVPQFGLRIPAETLVDHAGPQPGPTSVPRRRGDEPDRGKLGHESLEMANAIPVCHRAVPGNGPVKFKSLRSFRCTGSF